MVERWKTITFNNMDTVYEISNTGLIRNRFTKKPKSMYVGRKNYLRVYIPGSPTALVHRLVAMTFIPNPNNLPQINHKDGNKQNNCVDNLEWITNEDNIKHAELNGLCHSKLDETQVKEICNLLMDTSNTYKSIAEKYGVRAELVRCINKKTIWKRVSNEYDFPNRVINIPDQTVEKICECISKGMSTRDIVNTCGTYRTYVDRLRKGLIRKDLGKKYGFIK